MWWVDVWFGFFFINIFSLYKASWKWGPNGHGAILLVNCDSESSYFKEVDSENEEITKVSGKQTYSRSLKSNCHYTVQCKII